MEDPMRHLLLISALLATAGLTACKDSRPQPMPNPTRTPTPPPEICDPNDPHPSCYWPDGSPK